MLSAFEGVGVVTPVLSSWIVPLTVVALVALFAVQKYGTARVGMLFGPLMLVWFAVLAVLGISHIVRVPHVLTALNPIEAVRFFMAHQVAGYLVLGAVFLVVTGGEALYADMGHFGAKPIRLAWFAVVFPALLLNYFGQGALLLHEPRCGERSVLSDGAALGALAAGDPGDARRGRRVAGGDLRRVLADAAGRAARLSAAHPHPPHLRARDRADLHPLGQLAADALRDRARARVPAVDGIWPARTASR